MRLNRTFRLATVATALCFVGCSSEIPTYPVSGTVTQNGAPVEGAAVTFVPDAGGDSAVGITDANGVYSLKTKTRDGALAGSYKVAVAKYEGDYEPSEGNAEPAADPYDITNEYPDDYDEAKETEKAALGSSSNLLPERYADAAKSELTATVAEEDNTFDFDLEKK